MIPSPSPAAGSTTSLPTRRSKRPRSAGGLSTFLSVSRAGNQLPKWWPFAFGLRLGSMAPTHSRSGRSAPGSRGPSTPNPPPPTRATSSRQQRLPEPVRMPDVIDDVVAPVVGNRERLVRVENAVVVVVGPDQKAWDARLAVVSHAVRVGVKELRARRGAGPDRQRARRDVILHVRIGLVGRARIHPDRTERKARIVKRLLQDLSEIQRSLPKPLRRHRPFVGPRQVTRDRRGINCPLNIPVRREVRKAVEVSSVRTRSRRRSPSWSSGGERPSRRFLGIRTRPGCRRCADTECRRGRYPRAGRRG